MLRDRPACTIAVAHCGAVLRLHAHAPQPQRPAPDRCVYLLRVFMLHGGTMKPAYVARLAVATVLALWLSACASAVPPTEIEENPNPVQRYQLTVRVQDAPGRFDSVTASVDYQVVNSRCVPLQPVSGARLPPRKHLSVNLKRVGPAVYQGSFFADLMQDADYYGLGICHWRLVAAGARLQIRSVAFSPSIVRADIFAQKQVTTYFPVAAYSDRAVRDIVTGQPRTAYVNDHPSRFFSVTLDSGKRF